MQQTRGFTLIELLMVIAITGILSAVLVVFLRPALDSYFDTRRRSELSDIADTALRRMGQDIRSAVPNSLFLQSSTCFQLVPTIAGGRYRMASHVGAVSAAVDSSTTTTSFDVFNLLRRIPAANDWVVINNQNGNDVYAGTNRAQITSVDTPPPTPPAPAVGGALVGQHRININSLQFSPGYDGGRFLVVADTVQSVFYSCVNNVLYRTVAVFGANRANTCASTAGAVVAAHVANCEFTYDPNHGATQQSGYIQMQLGLADGGDSVTLTHGVHVENMP